MSYKVEVSPPFKKSIKRLRKRYRSIDDDVAGLIDELADQPFTGTNLGGQSYKIRLAITSKGKGKSGGARVITTVFVQREVVTLLDIYDKSEQTTMSEKDIAAARAEAEEAGPQAAEE